MRKRRFPNDGNSIFEFLNTSPAAAAQLQDALYESGAPPEGLKRMTAWLRERRREGVPAPCSLKDRVYIPC